MKNSTQHFVGRIIKYLWGSENVNNLPDPCSSQKASATCCWWPSAFQYKALIPLTSWAASGVDHEDISRSFIKPSFMSSSNLSSIFTVLDVVESGDSVAEVTGKMEEAGGEEAGGEEVVGEAVVEEEGGEEEGGEEEGREEVMLEDGREEGATVEGDSRRGCEEVDDNEVADIIQELFLSLWDWDSTEEEEVGDVSTTVDSKINLSWCSETRGYDDDDEGGSGGSGGDDGIVEEEMEVETKE